MEILRLKIEVAANNWLSEPQLSMSSKNADLVPPSPAELIESLRDFGYTLPSALSDLIDNSLAASAKQISVTVEAAGNSPFIAVLDNGHGMSEATLVEAMRMGTRGPLAPRSKADLGRFGLGMKTAALSQGRCVTVISKHAGNLSMRRWDLDHVRSAGDWQLLRKPTAVAEQFAERLEALRNGTAIVIENLDRASFLSGAHSSAAVHLATALENVRSHLAMIFHRFIDEDGIEICLGEGRIQSWDPFLTEFSTRLPLEGLRLVHRGEISIAPFVLPHHSRLSTEQYDRAAGPNGWNAHQGFYIYRCRRLIIPGTWLNLRLKKDECYKLARIRVDLPNTMDEHWQLNVMKSHVSAPSLLLDDLRRVASDVRRQAASVYNVRGERQAPTKAPTEQFVWRRESVRNGVRYCVDRSHPVVRALLHAGCHHDRLLEAVVTLIEATIPVASMLQEPHKAIDGAVSSGPPVDIDSMVDLLLNIEQHWIRTGKSLQDAREFVLSCEPFVRFRNSVIERLRERLSVPEQKGPR